MKDNEARGRVLQFLYERRKKRFYPNDDEPVMFPEEGPDEFYRICKQLVDSGLVDWEEHNIVSDRGGWVVRGDGIMLTPGGIDVVEAEGYGSPLPLIMPVHQTFNFPNSQGIQIGNHNSQNVVASLEHIIQSINSATAPEEEKEQVKGALKSFLSHPLVGTIAGASIPAMIGLLK